MALHALGERRRPWGLAAGLYCLPSCRGLCLADGQILKVETEKRAGPADYACGSVTEPRGLSSSAPQ